MGDLLLVIGVIVLCVGGSLFIGIFRDAENTSESLEHFGLRVVMASLTFMLGAVVVATGITILRR